MFFAEEFVFCLRRPSVGARALWDVPSLTPVRGLELAWAVSYVSMESKFIQIYCEFRNRYEFLANIEVTLKFLDITFQ